MTHEYFADTVIDEIRLENFRSFRNARIRLQGLTFLVGRNGAGKSNVLDAVDLMREALSDGLAVALRRRDGLPGVRHFGIAPHDPVGIAVGFSGQHYTGERARGVYGFRIHGSDLSDIEERVVFPEDPDLGFERRAGKYVPPAMRKKGRPLAAPKEALVLPQLPEQAITMATDLREVLSGMRTHRMAPEELAKPQPIRGEIQLARDGSNLSEVFARLREQSPPAANRVVASLSSICEGLVDVRANSIGGHTVLSLVRANGQVHEFGAAHASTGTLRALAMLVAYHSRGSLLAIDEIEDSMHPGAVQVLLDEFSAADLWNSADSEEGEPPAQPRPLLLTSHSPEVLSHPSAQPANVRVVQWRDGASSIYQLNDATAAAVSDLESIGDLLRHNALGLRAAPETWSDSLFAP